MMDDIINALKLPFTEVPAADRPSDKVIVAVWATVGALVVSLVK